MKKLRGNPKKIPARIIGGPIDGQVITIPLGVETVNFPTISPDAGFLVAVCDVRWQRDECILIWPDDDGG